MWCESSEKDPSKSFNSRLCSTEHTRTKQQQNKTKNKTYIRSFIYHSSSLTQLIFSYTISCGVFVILYLDWYQYTVSMLFRVIIDKQMQYDHGKCVCHVRAAQIHTPLQNNERVWLWSPHSQMPFIFIQLLLLKFEWTEKRRNKCITFTNYGHMK